MLEGGRSESRILPSKVKPLVHCSKASSRTNGTEKYPFPKEGDGGLEPIALQLMAVKYQSMTWIFHYAGGSECSGAEDAMIRKGVGCVSLAAPLLTLSIDISFSATSNCQDHPQREFD